MRSRSSSNPSANTPRPLRQRTSGVVIWIGVLAAAAFGLTLASAQPGAETPKATGAALSTPAAAGAATSPKAVPQTKPLWSELTAKQQQALQPLSPHWNTLNTGQKRKWLALSRNFATMSPDDRVTLHSRMSEWAALSNQQRVQARLNFAEVKRIPPDERKIKWEQYQALSAEEKRKLAERAPLKPRGAAVPARPVSTQRLVPVPAITPTGQHTPRILLAPPTPALAPAQAAPAAVMVSTPLERAPAPVAAPAAPAPAIYASPPVPAEAQVPPPELPAAAH